VTVWPLELKTPPGSAWFSVTMSSREETVPSFLWLLARTLSVGG
jgi:hypothetical protein